MPSSLLAVAAVTLPTNSSRWDGVSLTAINTVCFSLDRRSRRLMLWSSLTKLAAGEPFPLLLVQADNTQKSAWKT